MLIAICWFVIPAQRAEAWNPVKAAADKLAAAGRAIGGVLGAPVAGLVETAAAPVVRDFQGTGHQLIADLDTALATNLGRAGDLIQRTTAVAETAAAKLDHSLGARLLQVETTVDRTLGRIDQLIGRLEADARDLLDRAAQIGRDLIKQIDAIATKDLERIDGMLAARVTDLQLVVSSSIQQADDVARERLAQLDELAGRRIGNLDVIATKQSLSLEATAYRGASLLALVALIAFVAWRVFRELADAVSDADQRRAPRLRAMGWRSLTRLGPQLALAAAGAGLLLVLADHLPRGAEARARIQISDHVAALDLAVGRLDVADARYHASQLEILAPHEIADYRARVDKAALLQSLFTRPGQLQTMQGITELVSLVGRIEAVRRDDPDVMIAKAYILWRVGGTRDDEYEAATLCATALRTAAERGTAAPPPMLAPLARNYIAMFLDDPYTPRGGETAGLTELTRIAAPPPAGGEITPFDRMIELDRMIRTLDRASTAAYLDMLAAHAELRAALGPGPRGARAAGPPAARAARAARTAAASRLVEAWAAFDRELEASPALAGDPMVLSVFTLDDAVLTRARYWLTEQGDDELPPSLTAPDAARRLSPARRAQIAPLRVAWDRRYAPLLGRSEREIVAYQETRRFAAFEQRAAAFEAAYVAFLVAAQARPAPAALLALATTAATRASGMGLYRGTPSGRVSEASHILAAAGQPGVQPAPEALAIIAQNYQARRLRLL